MIRSLPGSRPGKPDISTLEKTRHFYFVLTSPELPFATVPVVIAGVGRRSARLRVSHAHPSKVFMRRVMVSAPPFACGAPSHPRGARRSARWLSTSRAAGAVQI